MSRRNSPHRLLGYLLRSPRNRSKGFTLIELLVAIIVGSLIVTTLLVLVLELLKISRREEVLTQTQQDMRRALDYIASDISEADYVYSTPAQLTNIQNQLSTDTSWPVGTPVLAFWRLDPVDISEVTPSFSGYSSSDPDGCIAAFNTAVKQAECSALKVRQSAYSLVVYLQVDNDGSSIWEGPSRIVRYELPKYSTLSTLDQTRGYDDPSVDDPNTDDESFATWIKGSGTPAGNVAVLTDHITATDSGTQSCPTSDYTRLPAASDSFYACVRSGDELNSSLTRVGGDNQSLIVYVTGDISRNAATIASSDASKLPTIQSEILVRGVIEKRPPDEN